MPVSVVVGGQFGSEGKGKVALHIAREQHAKAVVRVGGTNSGHTGVDASGRTWALRQLPVSVLAEDAVAVLPAGAIIDPAIFLEEVRRLGLGRDRVYVNRQATVITDADKLKERETGLIDRVGSTGSGSGAALQRRMDRQDQGITLAEHHGALEPYLRDTSGFMRGLLARGERVVVEGSQGYGLSLLHGRFPSVTTRDTLALTFMAEAHLGFRDLDDVTLVLRTFPIRVGGRSGPLPRETSWDRIARGAGLPRGYHEITTATRRVRRVGEFDPDIVRQAIDSNTPTRIVLNHLDYVDPGVREGRFGPEAVKFVEEVVERPLGVRIDWIGTDPSTLLDRSVLGAMSTSSK